MVFGHDRSAGPVIVTTGNLAPSGAMDRNAMVAPAAGALFLPSNRILSLCRMGVPIALVGRQP